MKGTPCELVWLLENVNLQNEIRMSQQKQYRLVGVYLYANNYAHTVTMKFDPATTRPQTRNVPATALCATCGRGTQSL